MSSTDLTARGLSSLDRTLATVIGEHRPSILRRVAWWEWMLLLAFLLVCLAVGSRATAHAGSRLDPAALSVSKGFAVCMMVDPGRSCARGRRSSAR